MASPLLFFSFFFITVAFNRQEKKKPGGCFHSNRKPIGPEEKREREMMETHGNLIPDG